MRYETLTGIVGLDFVDADGVRHFTFTLCSQGPDGFRARTVTDLRDEAVTRHGAIPALQPRLDAVMRLARRYRERSIPQRFAR